jgi:hypothetical protein
MNNEELFRQALQRQNDRASEMKMPDDMEQRVMKRIKSKSRPSRWLYAASISAIAAGLLILIGFSLFMKDGKTDREEPVVAQHKEQRDSTEKVEVESPMPMIAKDIPVVAQNNKEQHAVNIVKQPVKENETISVVTDDDKLNYYISQLEAEMEAVDDSVRSAHLEKLIAADNRLQQLVNRIVKDDAERAMNELQKDSTANYINF